MAGTFTGNSSAALPDHAAAFRTRRFLNWFPLGLAYAFLYMGRYNLNVAKNALGTLMTTEDFGIIFGAGTLVYGIAFLVNGPLTDRMGGRRAMLVSTAGSALSNLAMGLYLQNVVTSGVVDNASLRFTFSLLYGINMYFQSFGAVAIVKVNASWFHVRERGSFSGIFGTMISSGIFLAYTVNGWILAFAKETIGGSEAMQAKWVFFVPTALLATIFTIEFFVLKDRPSQAGHHDFDTGDASSGDAGDVPFKTVFRRILTNPIILTIALIEFCTGVVRQGVMQSYPFFAKNVLALPSNHYMRDGSWGHFWTTVAPFFAVAAVFFVLAAKTKGSRKGTLFASGGLIFLIPFLQAGWGGLLFVAGVIGSNVAGRVSDLFFQSRRAPAAGGLYAFLTLLTVGMALTMGQTTTVIESINAKKVQGLQPGDRIESIAGQTGFRDWVGVSNAFASIPATCLGGAAWDSKLHLCSSQPKETNPALAVSTGTIAIGIVRDGQQMIIDFKDPSMSLRAGERRVLKVTPVANVAPFWMGLIVILMSLSVIGTHGLLSGTATMDFGGRKGAATAVGMIDGFVYLGTAVQSVSLGYLTSKSWSYWPWFMLPFAFIGFLLCLRIWGAAPGTKRAEAPAPEPAPGVDPGGAT